MKKILALFGLLLLTACATQPVWYDWHPGKSLVQTINTSDVVIEIKDRKHDHEIWLTPGTHKIPFLCKSRTVVGGIEDPVIQQLTVRLGYRYEIRAEFQNQRPVFFVKEIPHWTLGDDH